MKVAGLLARGPNPDEVRWVLYAGQDAQGRTLEPLTSALEAQRQRWWIYHANDLCHIALETLLKFVLDTLGRYPAGITLARLMPVCIDQILQSAGRNPADWADFLNDIKPTANAYAHDSAESEWSSEAIMRRAGRSDEKICPPEVAWRAIKLLAILHKRVEKERPGIAAELEHFDPDAFHSLLSETRFLTRHLKESFAETLGRLLEERVIRRHLWVALRKFRYQRDYTFLIEMDDGRLRLREKDGPVFTNPRLGPAITFLRTFTSLAAKGLPIRAHRR